MTTHAIVRSILFTGVCLLATKLPSSAQIITVPDYSFNANGAGYSGSPYSNQSPHPFSTFPTNEIFADWESTSGNFQSYITPTSGYTGTFQGTTAGQINGPFQFVTVESLNPVATIANHQIYTLTFALSTPGGAGNVTLQLLATTQTADSTVYNDSPYYVGTSPYPVISTVAVLGSLTVTGATLNAAAGAFNDYTVTFDTFGGPNALYVGDNLTIALVDSPGSTVVFDNVRLSEAVPEPSTWALMLGGLALLGFCVRRKGALVK
jgi:hypothetical protein